jgi:hypothetical protein
MTVKSFIVQAPGLSVCFMLGPDMPLKEKEKAEKEMEMDL